MRVRLDPQLDMDLPGQGQMRRKRFAQNLEIIQIFMSKILNNPMNIQIDMIIQVGILD